MHLSYIKVRPIDFTYACMCTECGDKEAELRRRYKDLEMYLWATVYQMSDRTVGD